MSLKEIYDLTPTELYFLIKFKNKQTHQESVERYEIMRLQSFIVISPFTKVRSPEQLLKFTWDKGMQDTFPTQEEINDYRERYDNLPFLSR